MENTDNYFYTMLSEKRKRRDLRTDRIIVAILLLILVASGFFLYLLLSKPLHEIF